MRRSFKRLIVGSKNLENEVFSFQKKTSVKKTLFDEDFRTSGSSTNIYIMLSNKRHEDINLIKFKLPLINQFIKHVIIKIKFYYQGDFSKVYNIVLSIIPGE